MGKKRSGAGRRSDSFYQKNSGRILRILSAVHVQLRVRNLQVGGNHVLLHGCHGCPPHWPVDFRGAIEADSVDDTGVFVPLDTQVFRPGDGFVLCDFLGGFGENLPHSVRVFFVGQRKIDVIDSRNLGNLGDVSITHGHRVAGVEILEHGGHQGETQDDSLDAVDFHDLADDDGVIVDDMNAHDDVLEEILHGQAGNRTDDAHAGNHGGDVDIVGLKHGKNADCYNYPFDAVEGVPHEGPEADVFLVNSFSVFLGEVIENPHDDECD